MNPISHRPFFKRDPPSAPSIRGTRSSAITSTCRRGARRSHPPPQNVPPSNRAPHCRFTSVSSCASRPRALAKPDSDSVPAPNCRSMPSSAARVLRPRRPASFERTGPTPGPASPPVHLAQHVTPPPPDPPPTSRHRPPCRGDCTEQVSQEVGGRDQPRFGLRDSQADRHVRQDRRIAETTDAERDGKRQEPGQRQRRRMAQDLWLLGQARTRGR